MAVDHIRYDLLAQQALRGVLRSVLVDTAKNGLPGEHHFYISFETRGEGVQLSQRLRDQYPDEMTIILQHQFWDLVVGEEGFEVGLSFGGVPERLGVPFAAITKFFDPSVQFGLQFEMAETENAAVEESEPARAKKESPAMPRAQPRPAGQTAPALPISANPAPVVPALADADPESGKPAGGGEVVRLDRFRKK
jgi:hypothetical protein